MLQKPFLPILRWETSPFPLLPESISLKDIIRFLCSCKSLSCKWEQTNHHSRWWTVNWEIWTFLRGGGESTENLNIVPSVWDKNFQSTITRFLVTSSKNYSFDGFLRKILRRNNNIDLETVNSTKKKFLEIHLYFPVEICWSHFLIKVSLFSIYFDKKLVTD